MTATYDAAAALREFLKDGAFAARGAVITDLDGTAVLVEAVLRACPNVTVMATSREALHHSGEVPVTLKPLPAPDAAAPDAADSPAVRLFAARARTARP